MARGILGASVFRGPRARQQGLPLSRSYQMGGPVQNQSVMGVGPGARVGGQDPYIDIDVSGDVPEQRTDGYTNFLARSAPVDPVPAQDPYASISGRIRTEAGRRDVPDNFLDIYANAGYRRRQGLERFLMSREYKPDAFAQPKRLSFEDAQATMADPITVVQEPLAADGAPSQEPAGASGYLQKHEYGGTWIPTTTDTTQTTDTTTDTAYDDGMVTVDDTGDAQTGKDAWEDAQDQLQKDVADGTQTTDETDDETDDDVIDTSDTDDTDDDDGADDEETDGYVDFLSSADTGAGAGAGIPANILVEAGRRQVPDNFLEYYANAGYGERQRLENWLMDQEFRPDAFAQPGRVPFEEAQATVLDEPDTYVDWLKKYDTDTGTGGAGIPNRILVEAGRRQVSDNFLEEYANAGYGLRLRLENWLMEQELRGVLPGEQVAQEEAASDTGTTQTDTTTTDTTTETTTDDGGPLPEDEIAKGATDREEEANVIRIGEAVADTIQQEGRAGESLEPDFVPETLADSAAWLQGTPGFRQFNQPQFDISAFLEAGSNAPRRDIDIPETLYPWQEYTDAERDAGYTIPVFQPMATGEFQAPGGARFGAGTPRTSEDGDDGTVMSGHTTETTWVDEETGIEHTTKDGYFDPVANQWVTSVAVRSDTTAEDWTCDNGTTPYITNEGTWMCKATDTIVPTPASPKQSAAHGGPINAGIGNLMSRQRQYDYPDGTQMVEKVSQGRIPFGRR